MSNQVQINNPMKGLKYNNYLFFFQLLKDHVYEQVIHEYQCIPGYPAETEFSEQCQQGRCVQQYVTQPVLAVNEHLDGRRWHNLRVEWIRIDSGCRFEQNL